MGHPATTRLLSKPSTYHTVVQFEPGPLHFNTKVDDAFRWGRALSLSASLIAAVLVGLVACCHLEYQHGIPLESQNTGVSLVTAVRFGPWTHWNPHDHVAGDSSVGVPKNVKSPQGFIEAKPRHVRKSVDVKGLTSKDEKKNLWHVSVGETHHKQKSAPVPMTENTQAMEEMVTTIPLLGLALFLLTFVRKVGYSHQKTSMMSVSGAMVPSSDGVPLKPTKSGFAAMIQRLKDNAPPAHEVRKIMLLACMFFCILFNYTILRDTKDVLMITAPKSGAEVIPFLKTYINFPGAILFTILYSFLTNKMQADKVFYTLVSFFMGFFFLFAWVIYPNQGVLHPHAMADQLALALPPSFTGPIAIFRNWTFAVFYLMADLWGSVVISILFWGFSNQICTVKEAKKYYPLFGLGSNIAMIIAGCYTGAVSAMRQGLPAGVDAWGVSLKYLMSAILASGAVLSATYWYMQKNILTDPQCVTPEKQKAMKTKNTLGMKDSFKFLAASPYMRCLALLVVCYGMSINIVEVTWKARLHTAFPDPNAYSAFMGKFSSTTGTATLVMMVIGRIVFQIFGWGVAAAITPLMLAITGGIFFTLILAPDLWAPVAALAGLTPLMLSVFVGATQNILTKSCKYVFFEPCKEMAYIPLDTESKTKGKAAVDVVGDSLGKSGGSFLQQILILSLGSLGATTPYLGVIMGVVVVVWLSAAKSLSGQFSQVSTDHDPPLVPKANLSPEEEEGPRPTNHEPVEVTDTIEPHAIDLMIEEEEVEQEQGSKIEKGAVGKAMSSQASEDILSEESISPVQEPYQLRNVSLISVTTDMTILEAEKVVADAEMLATTSASIAMTAMNATQKARKQKEAATKRALHHARATEVLKGYLERAGATGDAEAQTMSNPAAQQKILQTLAKVDLTKDDDQTNAEMQKEIEKQEHVVEIAESRVQSIQEESHKAKEAINIATDEQLVLAKEAAIKALEAVHTLQQALEDERKATSAASQAAWQWKIAQEELAKKKPRAV